MSMRAGWPRACEARRRLTCFPDARRSRALIRFPVPLLGIPQPTIGKGSRMALMATAHGLASLETVGQAMAALRRLMAPIDVGEVDADTPRARVLVRRLEGALAAWQSFTGTSGLARLVEG
jgi:hypothetical protein